MKKVRAIDDIVFDNQEIPLVRKGTEFSVAGVIGSGIVLHAADGEDYVIDTETFEAGFEIAQL